MSYYADDASLLMANAPAINGKDAIRAAFKPVFDDPNFALAFQASRIEVASLPTGLHPRSLHPDHHEPQTKKPFTDKGKY